MNDAPGKPPPGYSRMFKRNAAGMCFVVFLYAVIKLAVMGIQIAANLNFELEIGGLMLTAIVGAAAIAGAEIIRQKRREMR